MKITIMQQFLSYFILYFCISVVLYFITGVHSQTQVKLHQNTGNQKVFIHHLLLIQKCFLNNKQVLKFYVTFFLQDKLTVSL